jgi:hypothetical protein
VQSVDHQPRAINSWLPSLAKEDLSAEALA